MPRKVFRSDRFIPKTTPFAIPSSIGIFFYHYRMVVSDSSGDCHSGVGTAGIDGFSVGSSATASECWIEAFSYD